MIKSPSGHMISNGVIFAALNGNKRFLKYLMYRTIQKKVLSDVSR